MKIRFGFVSNSSSTCFVIGGPAPATESTLSSEELAEYIRREDAEDLERSLYWDSVEAIDMHFMYQGDEDED